MEEDRCRVSQRNFQFGDFIHQDVVRSEVCATARTRLRGAQVARAAIFFRRQVAKHTPAKPRIIIARIAGSQSGSGRESDVVHARREHAALRR